MMVEYDGYSGMGSFFGDFVNMPNELLKTSGQIVNSPGFQNAAAMGANAYITSQTGGMSPGTMANFTGGSGAVGGNSQQQYWPENQMASGALQNMMGPQAQLNPAGIPRGAPPRRGISPVLLIGGVALLAGVVLVLKKK